MVIGLVVHFLNNSQHFVIWTIGAATMSLSQTPAAEAAAIWRIIAKTNDIGLFDSYFNNGLPLHPDLPVIIDASIRGDVDSVIWFHTHGINLTTVDLSSTTYRHMNALAIAAFEGHVDVVKYLVNTEVLRDAKTELGNAMIYAASSGCCEIVELLLAKGTDVNFATSKFSGDTALHRAVKGNHKCVIRKLLSCGADMDIKNQAGRTVATYHCLTTIQKILDDEPKRRAREAAKIKAKIDEAPKVNALKELDAKIDEARDRDLDKNTAHTANYDDVYGGVIITMLNGEQYLISGSELIRV